MQAPDPVWNVVCFLAEQCAEKYLKGFLEEQNIAFQKIHDLVVLLNTSTGLLSALDPLKPQLAHLSTFGIAARYPGVQADQQAAGSAMKTMVRQKAKIQGCLSMV
jgi:HEPN domain-containing protein